LGLALQLPKDAMMLDLACAEGNWLSILASCGYRRLHGHIVAVPSPRVAERLTFLRSFGIAITEGSFASQEYPSASFDLIRIRDGLATLTEPAATVRQCLRMLKPTGVLLLQVPHPAAAWVCVTRAQAAKPHEAPCHVYHHTADALSSLLSAAGFRDLQALAANDTASLPAIVNNMRHQAGKAPVPMLLSWLLRPAYTFTRMFQSMSEYREQRDWLTLVVREPAVLRQHAPQNENGQSRTSRHQRGYRPALFTRS
jgi:SAM-dependent methyltransferase